MRSGDETSDYGNIVHHTCAIKLEYPGCVTKFHCRKECGVVGSKINDMLV